MIETIKIQNFQSHKNTQITLHPGVNIIIGVTDSGKSAVIRALRWLIYGKPRGEGFRSHWGGDTRVELWMENSHVTRNKTNTQQFYSLFEEGMEGPLSFTAFGNDTPDEILNTINMDEINIQQQLDTPFLINNTPGEVAIHFNRVANLEKIDSSLKVIQSSIRGMEQTIKAKTDLLKDYRGEYVTFNWVDEAETGLEELEQKMAEQANLKNQVTRLTELQEQINAIQIRIIAGSTILQAVPFLDELTGLLQDKEQTIKTITNLTTSVETLEKVRQDIQNYEKITGAEILVNEVSGLILQSTDTETIIYKLNKVLINISKIQTFQRQTTQILGEQEQEFSEVFPSICPLCGQKIEK